MVLTIENAHDGFVKCMKVIHRQGHNIMVTGGNDKCIKIWRIYWNDYKDRRGLNSVKLEFEWLGTLLADVCSSNIVSLDFHYVTKEV